MASIPVILRQDVPNLGTSGEVKQVAPGYFRNFLLPRGLAVEASRGQMNALKANTRSRKAQVDRAAQAAQALAQQLSTLTVRIPVRVGEQGRIHGSVTNKDVAEALEAQGGVSVDRHKIEFSEPLRSLGTHSVSIKLEHGIEATTSVELVPEG